MSASTYSPAAASLAMFAQLRAARRAARLTQAQVAGRLRVVLRTFQRWEHGETEPTMSDLFRWAATLGFAISARPIVEYDNSVASAAAPAPLRHLATPALAALHYGEDGLTAASCHVNRVSARSLAGRA